MPKTCKSYEVAHGSWNEVGELAQRWSENGSGLPPSGARVSNTWESTFKLGITVGNDC
jgi:hypothetical protein